MLIAEKKRRTILEKVKHAIERKSSTFILLNHASIKIFRSIRKLQRKQILSQIKER